MTLARSMLKNSKPAAAKAAWICLQDELLHVLSSVVSKECAELCEHNSIFRRSSPNELKNVTMNAMLAKVQRVAPTFYTVISAATGCESEGPMATAISILLKQRNKRVSALAYVISILL